ncbi:1-deoxy-D-xylulose-5-phosphate reductoisomerase [Malacoplasma penetrans]|nr:1-deoxy-D-xylulose-5-phosphate reductoisomerase [Malacoplasma penetrans]
MENKKKKVLVFGATGNIGFSSLEIIEKENYELVGFSFNNNYEKALEIINRFPNALVFSPSVKTKNTVNSFEELLEKTNPDIILNALVGFSGLHITLLALKNNVDLALANKESLVVAGWLIEDLKRSSSSRIYPVDSEHSSLYDSLKNNNKEIKELIITCSGGPFYKKEFNELLNINFADAVKHPNWNMGKKISIDSATMMNKCFEIIEAYYLFNTKKIKVYQHGQSIIHSMIKFTDNSYIANMSVPDMKLSIQQGLSGYESKTNLINDLSFNNLNLTFSEIDLDKWKPIHWAYDFLENQNRAIPIIMNAANEEAIVLFEENKIKFLDIFEIIEKAIIALENTEVNDLKDILNLNKNTRKYVYDFSKNKFRY